MSYVVAPVPAVHDEIGGAAGAISAVLDGLCWQLPTVSFHFDRGDKALGQMATDGKLGSVTPAGPRAATHAARGWQKGAIYHETQATDTLRKADAMRQCEVCTPCSTVTGTL